MSLSSQNKEKIRSKDVIRKNLEIWLKNSNKSQNVFVTLIRKKTQKEKFTYHTH